MLYILYEITKKKQTEKRNLVMAWKFCIYYSIQLETGICENQKHLDGSLFCNFFYLIKSMYTFLKTEQSCDFMNYSDKVP